MRSARLRVAAAAATSIVATSLALGTPAASAVDCPGAQPACPYTASSQIGYVVPWLRGEAEAVHRNPLRWA